MGVPYYRSRRYTAAVQADAGPPPTPAALIDSGPPPPPPAPITYPVEVVPASAADAVAWLAAGIDDADTAARAAAVAEAEAGRPSPRKTVTEALARIGQ